MNSVSMVDLAEAISIREKFAEGSAAAGRPNCEAMHRNAAENLRVMFNLHLDAELLAVLDA